MIAHPAVQRLADLPPLARCAGGGAHCPSSRDDLQGCPAADRKLGINGRYGVLPFLLMEPVKALRRR